MALLPRPTLAHRLLAAGASLGLALLLSGAVLFALRLPAAFAATTITVTSTADDLTVNGNCTLREAVKAANTELAVDACPAGSGADTISLPAGTFTLALAGAEEDANATGDLDVLASVTIEGASATTTIVDANGLDRVFDVYSPAQVIFRHLTLRGGDAGSGFAGGGVFVGIGAVVTVTESTVRDNQAGAEGGGVEAWGTVLIEHSAILSNTTYDGSDNGGGIGILDGVVYVDNSTIAYNSAHAGGGVGILFGGAITVTNSTFAFNAYTTGGGDDLYLFAGEMVLRNSILAGVDNCWIGGTGLLTGDNNLITHATFCDDNGSSDGRVNAPTNLSASVADNGGQTPTLALLAGSNALNAGTGSCLDHAGNALTTDQRGTARPQGAACDIGAYERAVAPGITVDAFTDDLTNNGNCTLREAVKAANTNAAVDTCAAGTTGLDTITLAAGTYTLSLSGAGENANATGDLDVTSATQIIGAGAATTLIDGGALDRVIDVQGSAAFALDGVTVRNGYLTSASGAGLKVNTSSLLTLTSVIFTNNWVDSASNWDGGAVWSNAAATVSGAQFISNTASNWGGGAYFGAATTITGSTFLSNTLARGSGVGNGGGAYLAQAAAITNTTFEGNAGQNLGGGLYLANAASSILNSTFVRNSAPVNGGGGILLLQGGTISGSTVMSNTAPTGAGSYSTNNTTTILNSTYFSNTASSRGGGAFLNTGTLTISGSTFISNSAGNLGGGGALFSTAGTIVNSTFQNNVSAGAGGGVSMANAASSISNSYFLTNTAVFGGGANLSNGGIVTGSTFQSNTASSTAGGLNLQFNSPLWITNTNFISNTFTNAANSAGGLRANGPVTITGGLFQGNTCPGTTCSGAGLAATQATLISGTQFVNNTGAFGAAVVASSGSLTVTNATFQGNTGRGAPAINSFVPTVIADSTFLSNTATHNSGGAVYVNQALTITGGRFEGNQTLSSSGGALDKGSTQNLSISGTQFINNSSAFYGGAVSSYISASVYLTNVQFLTNTAVSGGGALYVYGSSAVANVAVTGSLFQGNTASGGGTDGGAALIDRPLSLLLAGNRFLSNSAPYGGALTFWNLPADSRVQNNLFAGNTSPQANPGSVVHYGNGTLNFEHNTVVSATAGSSAALYLVGGTANVTNNILSNYPTVFEVSFGATLNEDYNLFDGYTQIFVGAAGPFPAVHDRLGSQPFTADYHLAAAGEAVNTGLAGSVATDFDGEARPQGDGVDLGYDEVATASTAISGLVLANNSPQLANDLVAFTATVSTGTGLTYDWNFGDGSPVETNTYAEMGYAYPAAGSYTAVVTATNTTNSQSATTSVTVLAAPSGAITVTTAADNQTVDGECSLREALAAANGNTSVDSCGTGGSDDLIVFDATLAGQTIRLSSPLVVSTNVTLDGAALGVTVSGDTNNNGSPDVQLFQVTAGQVAFNGLTFTRGTAANGGALEIAYGTVVTVTNSTFSDNTASTGGGAIDNTGMLTIDASTFSGNSQTTPSINGGGALESFENTTIRNSTFYSNTSANDGGAIVIANLFNTTGRLEVVNSTFSWNYTTLDGMDIASLSEAGVLVRNSTFTGGPGGGGGTTSLRNIAAGPFDVENSLLVTDYACYSGEITFTNSLVTDPLCDTLGAVDAGDVLLDPALADNGGPTWTHALLPGSSALNAGASSCPDLDDSPLTTDQRGVARPQGAACDIGAFERELDAAVTGLSAANSSPTPFGQSTAFSATVTSGDNITYAWNFGDGATGAGATTSHSYAAAGSYTAVVTATNTSSTVTATTEVEITNVPPVADAGPDQAVEVEAPVTLDGTGSTAEAGHDPLTYGWTQIGGPSVTLDDAAAAQPTFTAPATPAVLTFTLTVTDNLSLASAPDAVVITVTDQAITGLGADNDGPTTLGEVTQLGAFSDTGTNIVYTWDFGDGVLSAGEPTSHTYGAAGFYTAVVTATNGANFLTATTEVEITNLAPYADTTGNQTVDVNQTVYLDGSASNDDDGHLPLTFGWAQTGGPAVTLSNSASDQPTFTAPASPTVLTFTLTVTDSTGLADSTPALVVITVQDEAISGLSANNDGPTTLGESTGFEALYDFGTHVTLAWNFGDGFTGAGSSTSHTYAAAGSYTAVVTATNSTNVVTATTAVEITNAAPTADAGTPQTVNVGETVYLDGSASDDSDGHLPLTFGWQQTGGPAVTLSNSASDQPSFTAPSTPAVITFTLTVTDSHGLADTTPDTVVITVQDEPITGLTADNDGPTTLGQSTALSSDFGTGSNIVYAWNFGDGATGAGASDTHTYAAAGSYTAVVTATNGTSTVTATTSVSITNLAPVADAGSDQTVAVGDPVTLDGTNSHDPDGHDPLTYSWAQTGGPSVTLDDDTSAQPSFTAPSTPAVLTFTLSVTDNAGLAGAAPDSVVITVTDTAITGLSAGHSGPTTLGGSTDFSSAYDTGTNVSLAWSFGDGATGAGDTPSHTYAAAGFYTAVLTATNGTNVVTATTEVEITNLAPYADAGGSQTVTVGETVYLDGSLSNDDDGHTPLTYAWRQTGGPAVSLTNPYSVEARFTAPNNPTVLTFTLTVTDSAGLAGLPDTAVITVQDEAITGLAASNDGPTTLGQSTSLSADYGTGSNLTYAWRFGDGSTGTGSNPSHTYAAAGSYTAVVTATNSTSVVTAATTVQITNLAPLADAGPDQTVAVDEPVTLDGSGSSDPDGHDPLEYNWAQIGGPAVSLDDDTSAQPSFTAPSTPAILTFTLSVTDNEGLAGVAPDTVVITVTDTAITSLVAANSSPTTLTHATAFTASVGTGSNLTYAWNFGDGATGSGVNDTHVYAAVGSYTAVVTATNSANTLTATTTVTITNLAPTANAGPDQTVDVGDPVTLNGSASADADGHTPLTYGWEQTGGPAVSLSSSTAAQPTFTASASPTVLTFTLTVTDSTGLVTAAPDEVVISVGDEAITGLAADSSSPTTLTHATDFTATETSGSNIAYSWSFGDGATGSGAAASHTYAAVGSYTAVVTATNGTSTVTATTSVSVTNLAPVANAGPDQPAAVGALVTLDGTASADPDGHTPLTYGWEQTGGPAVSLSSATAAQPTFTAPATPAVLTLTLTVTDSTGLADATPDTVVISVGDEAVTGLAADSSSPTTLGQATAFTATIISGSNPAYAWDFGDGATGSGATTTHSYAAVGSYTAVVTATNGGGSVTATTSVSLTNLPPVANAGPDQPVSGGALVTLDGTASADPDGHTPLTYGWSQTGGPAVSLSSLTAAQPTFTAPSTPTVLTFTLTVTDSTGLADGTPDAVVITVTDVAITGLAAGNDSPSTLGHFTNFSATVATGTNVSYTWDFGDGTTGSGATTDHIYGATGSYTAVVTATNSANTLTATTSVEITNLAPVANAGSDQTVTVGETVTLDGTASNDPDDHTPLSYRWAQLGGPAITFDNSASNQPTFTAPSLPAVITLTLTVTDTYDLASAPDTVVITVTDTAITGLAANTDSPSTLGHFTNYTATVATGTNVSYAWGFGDGTTGAGATTDHIYGAVGSYTAVVTATNGTSTVTATTSVSVTNLAPLANAGSDQTVAVNELVTLDGTASSDPDDHTPLSYRWAQTGGPAITFDNSASDQPTFTAPAAPAVITLTLTVTDTYDLASAPDTIVITVTDTAITGLAAASNSPTTLTHATAFTATQTAGTNVTYAWSYGDGQTGTGATITHTYAAVGSYTAVVTATNGTSTVTATTSVSITNLAPVADAGTDQSVNTGALVTLNGAASADPDGHTPLTYGWSQTGGAAVTLSSATAGQPTFTAPASPTVLTFTLTVTDSTGLADSTPDSVVITVTDAAITGLSAANSSPTTLGQPTALTATVSAGSGLSYAWSFGDGATGSGATTSHTYAAVGSYTAVVTATNGGGSVTATTSVSITNLPPVADAGPDQTVIVSSLVTLNGTSSADPDGHTPLTRAWAQAGGPAVTLSSASAAQPTFTAPAAPTVLTFTLTVTDSTGLVDGTPDSVVITVTNQAITGLAAVSTSPDDVGQTTFFTATLTTGTNVTYAWNFGDNTPLGSGATTSHAYAVAGSYTATVTATNSLGSVVATTPVSLVAGQHTCTQAALTSAINTGGSGTVTLDGSCIYQLTSATFNSGSSGPSGYLLSNASVIEGNGAVIERAPGAPAFRLLYLNKAGIIVRNLTVRGGLASGANAFAYGGGFLVNFNSTLENVRIENNQAGIGAGMFVNSSASVTFVNSAIVSNTASSYGGGLYTSNNLDLVLRNTQVTNNTANGGPGGGLDTYATTVLLSNSTVTGNRSLAGGGGGLYTSSAASVVISGTVFRSNTATGGGGAVQTFATSISVVNSVFSGNQAVGGGAGLHVSSSGSLSVLHSTFVDTLRNPNPAIFVWGSARITNTILSGYAQGLGTAGGSLYPVTEDYNLFANNGVDAQVIYNGANLTRGAHSVVAAGPGLVNPAGGDFHPVATSAALNAGVTTGPATDLDGLARPFGSAVDLGAYEFQQAAVASLAVTQSGPPWVMPGAPLRYVLMVYNPSLVAADNLELVNLLPAGANYVGGSATGGGTLGGSTLTWNLGTLAARSSLRLEYVVTATSTLTHASYYVHSTSNALITATGASLVTPVNANIVASLGFFPNPDGYSFPNYGDSPDSDLTVDDMVYIYGADKVCKTTGPCVLTAAAEAWRLAWIDLVKGGHCAGMAMSSLLIFDRADLTPATYQGGANVTYDLTKANVRRLIALYATTQTRTPVNRTGLTGNVTAYGAGSVLNTLISNFNTASPADRYRLGFVKADGTGGHAVTPYAVEQRGADEYWIYVYDNNYPNNFDRVFKVTPSTNTWVYEGGATIPGAPVSAYRGDASQLGNIVLQSLRWAERFPKVCDSACTPAASADSASLLGGVETDMLEFQLDGEGYLLITRSDGLRVGYDPVASQYVYEIPGAEEVQVVTGIGLNAPPLYRVPATPGYTYSVQVSNRDNALGQLTATANVNILGPGYVLRLKNLQMNSAEPTPVDSETSLSVAAAEPRDTVSATFDPETRRVTFTASALDGDTPSVYLALTNPDGSDYIFELSSLHLGAGTSLALRYEAATGKLFVENDHGVVDTFDLYVQRLNLDGTVNTYTGTGLSDGDGVGVIAEVGDTWDGTSAPNVTTNYTPSLGVIKLYLPLITR